MGKPAKMGQTGSSEGQEGMQEFCNLDVPAGHLASDRDFFESVKTTLWWAAAHIHWLRSLVWLLPAPDQQWQGVSDGFPWRVSGEQESLMKNPEEFTSWENTHWHISNIFSILSILNLPWQTFAQRRVDTIYCRLVVTKGISKIQTSQFGTKGRTNKTKLEKVAGI